MNWAADDLNVARCVGFYWIVSITLVFLNKSIMSPGFSIDSPILFTWMQTLISAFLCFTCSIFGSWSIFPPFEYKLSTAKQVLPFTIVFMCMILANNYCLRHVQVSFYQVARSMTIVFNLMLTYFLRGEHPSRSSIAACLIVVIGYILGCEGEIQVSAHGVLFGLLGSLCVAVYSMHVKRILPVVDNNSWRLLTYNNINASLLFPLLISLEPTSIKLIFQSDQWSNVNMWLIVVCSGAFGFLINIASFAQIRATSALTHNVSGTAKAGVQTALAYCMAGNVWTSRGLIGLCLVLIGSCLYCWTRHNSKGGVKPEEHDLKSSKR